MKDETKFPKISTSENETNGFSLFKFQRSKSGLDNLTNGSSPMEDDFSESFRSQTKLFFEHKLSPNNGGSETDVLNSSEELLFGSFDDESTFIKPSPVNSPVNITPIDKSKSEPITPIHSQFQVPRPRSTSSGSSLFPRPGTPTPSRDILTKSAPMLVARKLKLASKSSFSPPAEEKPNEEESRDHFIEIPRRLSLSSNDGEENDNLISKARSFDDRHARTPRKQNPLSMSMSPTDLIGSFVGSFQESLLSGHMSNTPSTMHSGFVADMVASGKNYLSPHVKIPFTAIYYHIDMDTPYVGTIELDKKGFQVPQKGMIQLTIINPTKTPIKTFLVKYDLSDMPPSTRTFLRQKIVSTDPQVLRYAIHLKFVSPKQKKYFLYKNIRIVFAHRTPDDHEKLQCVYDQPDDPKYFPYTPKKKSSGLQNSMESVEENGMKS